MGSGGIWWDLVGSGGIWWWNQTIPPDPGSWWNLWWNHLIPREPPDFHVWQSIGGSLWNQRKSIVEWRVKHIEAFSGFMDRGDCSRIIDGDSAPIRERDLGAPSARELTKRIGSLRHFLRLVNGSSGGASSIDKIADEAGKPFGLVGNTVRMYVPERAH